MPTSALREGLRQSALCFEQAIAADDIVRRCLCGFGRCLQPDGRLRLGGSRGRGAESQAGRRNSSALGSTILGGSRLAGVCQLHVRMGLGGRRCALSAVPSLSTRATRARITGTAPITWHSSAGSMRRSEKPRSRVIWTRCRRSSWKACGYVHMMSRDYADAHCTNYQQLSELDPVFLEGLRCAGTRASACWAASMRPSQLWSGRARWRGDVPSFLARHRPNPGAAGFVWEARACWISCSEIHKTQWVPSSCFAIVHIGLGDHEAALTHLESACDKREQSVSASKVHPLYDPAAHPSPVFKGCWSELVSYRKQFG